MFLAADRFGSQYPGARVSIFASRRSAVAAVAALICAAGSVGVAPGASAVSGAVHPPAHPPVAHGERVAVVAVPGGRQAAVYDQHGHLTFWRQPKSVGRWLRSGASTYPLLPAPSAADARVAAVHLVPMPTAVFIVHGLFTGDGDADWIAFGKGPRGWGRLAPRSGELIPTGKGSTDNTTPGLALHIQVAGGLLETSAEPDVVSFAQGPLLPVNRFWAWNGSAFAEARDNVVGARPAPDPLGDAARVSPLRDCPAAPPNGVYSAVETSVSNLPRQPFSFNAGVTVTVRLSPLHGSGRCSFTVPETFGISLPMTTGAGGTRWITGPVWLLSTVGSLGDIRDTLVESDFRPRGAAPYFIPPVLGVSGFARVAAALAPAAVHATIRGGHLAALAVLPAPGGG